MLLETLLEARGLSVRGNAESRNAPIVADVSFVLQRGEILCILGESGSGKTTLAHALTGLRSSGSALAQDGKVLLQGRDIVSLTPAELQQIRREKVRYIFQEAVQALNPLLQLGTQFLAGAPHTASDMRGAAEALGKAGIDDTATLLSLYPHQASVGMLQRFLLALAVYVKPLLLIADEPTSALDPEMRDRFSTAITRERTDRQMSAVVVTHDASLARNIADTIAIMYLGRFVEYGPAQRIFENPRHPYTKRILRGHSPQELAGTFRAATGVVQSVTDALGCAYRPLCEKSGPECLPSPIAMEQCEERHVVRCLHWKS
jgi:oligopeptide/dipeptide ABC transporter ATP-binding protein